jgi:hypothetical protein
VTAAPALCSARLVVAGLAAAGLAAAGLAAAGRAAAGRAGAQQYITDDAGLTADRACQIQTWFGQRASWVLPVCTPVHNVELSLGFIAVRRDADGRGHFEYVVQAKTLVRPVRPGRWGAGLVVGAGRDPALAGTSPDVRTYYTYVPVSRAFFGDRVLVHQNAGWLYQRSGAERSFGGRHALTWAARADVALGGPRRGPPLVAVVEAYGAEGAAGADAEFQAGVRAFPRRDAVQLDLSYGGFVRTGRRAAGWTLGLTLATPPFL